MTTPFATSLRTAGALTIIDVRVVPRASANSVAGMRDGKLLLRVTAPPVDHAANEAVTGLIARVLEVPQSRVRLAAGLTSRNKSIAVTGLSVAEVADRLGRASTAG